MSLPCALGEGSALWLQPAEKQNRESCHLQEDLEDNEKCGIRKEMYFNSRQVLKSIANLRGGLMKVIHPGTEAK